MKLGVFLEVEEAGSREPPDQHMLVDAPSFLGGFKWLLPPVIVGALFSIAALTGAIREPK